MVYFSLFDAYSLWSYGDLLWTDHLLLDRQIQLAEKVEREVKYFWVTCLLGNKTTGSDSVFQGHRLTDFRYGIKKRSPGLDHSNSFNFSYLPIPTNRQTNQLLQPLIILPQIGQIFRNKRQV